MEIPIILQMVAILFCWKLTAKKPLKNNSKSNLKIAKTYNKCNFFVIFKS